ncbi:hypothetical protein L0U85_14315 [Glycomyces sp. L485]|uniref:hypothetical protein n=1 Tax=Glycomyces sp. L485 TaxID=2909235 RepID=UPI001F4AEBBF|nr:hypothetical protein [Glycomyces sp. L485]MCH7232020.1 hypothetical protein [Glycomyces sp. L485]
MRDSRTDTDERFVALVTAAADGHARRVLDGLDGLLAGHGHHRTVMAGAKALIACAVHGGSRFEGSEETASAALRLVEHLAGMQGDDGLFDAENLASPPDTAFTVNDLCDAWALLGGATAPTLVAAASTLERTALSALESLLHGGVHTPNHRWELCAALARMHRHWPDPRLVERVDQWLAEGVDIADDGMYSERSANYALHVSNPSLTAIATALDRPELLDAVCRNLEAIAATTLPDGTVETVHSRRQDQRGAVDVAGFLMQFRRFAIARSRGDFADVVEKILERPLQDPAGALTEILLEPELAIPLPVAAPSAPVRAVFPSSGLAVVRDGDFYASVYGGSDYAGHGRIRSGLASNPTFLRAASGRAVLDAVRLSRDFFGLGPFRADGLEEDEGAFILRERVGASYYGPLPAEHRRADGRYELTDDGRFSASMDFAHRPAVEVALATRLRIQIVDDVIRIDCEADPAKVNQRFELTFRPGGAMTGAKESAEQGVFELAGTSCAYRCVDDVVRIEVSGADSAPAPTGYHPGEDYTHLSGTDATDGVKLHVPLGRTGRTTLALRFGRA